MRIYNYDESGEFIAESKALESPLEPGIFLIPRNSTVDAPPEQEEGFVRVFNSGEWIQVLDKRGVIYWLSHEESRTITEIGEDVPEGAFLEQPEQPTPEPQPITQVTAWQAKTALIQAGLFAQVEAAINSIEGEAGQQARADWVSAVTWRRDWATIALMQQAFGWTDEYVDQLFLTASQL